jgi:hypothetical protein
MTSFMPTLSSRPARSVDEQDDGRTERLRWASVRGGRTWARQPRRDSHRVIRDHRPALTAGCPEGCDAEAEIS